MYLTELMKVYERAITQGNQHERDTAKLDILENFEDDQVISKEQYDYLMKLYDTFSRLGS